MNYYITALKKYFVFEGRSTRSEYWYFFLFNFLISVVLMFIGSMMNGGDILVNIYGLAVLIPGLAVGIRRLHDTGRSGWMILIGLIPILGWIWLIVLLAMDSTPGPNKYGPNPKGVTAPAQQ